MSLIEPPGQTFRLADLSKEQLGRMVNAQSQELRGLQREKRDLMTLLAAIVRSPDALTHTDTGHAVFPVSALDDLPEGTQLRYRQHLGTVHLALVTAPIVRQGVPGPVDLVSH